MKKVIDITGKKFGRLTVIRQEYIKNHHVYWFCKCDCGNECVIKGDRIKSGHTKSCGCLKQEFIDNGGPNKTHGETKTRLYAIWGGMITRCENKKREKSKRDYQDRGIIVCPEWHEFTAFHDWALSNGYSDSLTIDRKDNDQGYFPENCRWTTAKVQGNNKRNNRNFTYKNETKTIAQWAEITRIKYSSLYARLVTKGWNIEKALTTPVGYWRYA
jgi:hypothetical protein